MTRYMEYEIKEEDLDLAYEKKFLLDLVKSLKILKSEFGIRMELTGTLVERLSETLNIKSDALYFAGYYANIGLLILEKIVSKSDFIESTQEKNLIKEHVYYSASYLEARGLFSAAKIVELHHEKPDGRGYFSVNNKNKDSAIVNIADEFVGLSSNKHYKPHSVKKIAISKTISSYVTSSIFTKDEQSKIIDVLDQFYNVIRSVQ